MKKIKFISLVLGLTLIGSSVVSATGSGYIKSPDSLAGTYSASTKKYACYTGNGGTALGSNSYTYFNNPGTLQSSFSSTKSRTLKVELWDYDPGINANDKIKTYECKFNNRKPDYTFTITPHVSGAIDGSGDDCAELYYRYIVSKEKNDPKNPSIADGLFYANVGVK